MKARIITREEEIEQAEIKYSNDTLFDDCDYTGEVAKEKAFIAGAKWADETMIEKACEYLKSSLKHDLGYYGAADFADTFRKAMEE